jgi:hypothetical protein
MAGKKVKDKIARVVGADAANAYLYGDSKSKEAAKAGAFYAADKVFTAEVTTERAAGKFASGY